MRSLPLLLALYLILPTTVRGGAPACPGGTASLEVFADNPTGATVTIGVKGEHDGKATCGDAGATSYEGSFECPAGGDPCGTTIHGLRPGAWVHRIFTTVSDPDSAEQVQAQRGIALTGQAVRNAVHWTLFARAFVVADATEASLRAALVAAQAFTEATPGAHALVRFDRTAFPGADAPTAILLESNCGSGAAICFSGSRIVVDALDDRGRPGGVVWLVGQHHVSVLRVLGNDNVFRGLLLRGSNLEARCDDEVRLQSDTVSITAGARGNTIELCTIYGPSCGDSIGVDRGASGTTIRESQITGAEDRGVKANAAFAEITRSCIHDNEGGIQSTLGGEVVARENIVQRNPGSGNGLTAIDQCSLRNPGCQCPADDPQCTPPTPSRLSTKGNVVRFSGTDTNGRGLAITNNARGDLDSDYFANNAAKEAAVDTNARVPRDAQGNELAPSATFRGVAVLCNNRGVGAETRADPGRTPPVVDFGHETNPGRNAFTANTESFLLTNLDSTVRIPAFGNQWQACPGATCTAGGVRANAIVPAGDTRVLLATSFDGASPPVAPTITDVTPRRPRAGDIVRIYGDGFDAINGNPEWPACKSATLPACTDDRDCSTGPCVANQCPCAIDNPLVRDRNSPANPLSANRVVIRSNGVEVDQIAPDAVTPTMLAFPMPWDCSMPMTIEVWRQGALYQSQRFPLCDPLLCANQPPGTACDDADPATIADRCNDAGRCAGDRAPTTTSSTSTSTTSTSTTSSTIAASTTTTTITTTTSTALASTTSTVVPTTTTSTTPRPSSSTSSTTTTSTPTTTKPTASPTTTTTLPPSCDPCNIAACNIQQCLRRLRRQVTALARSTCKPIRKGRPPRPALVKRLQNKLSRCGIPLPVRIPTGG